MDAALNGGLVSAALHEIYAGATAGFGGVVGFATALSLRAGGARPLVWVQQNFLDIEMGALNASGLSEIGLDPSRIILVKARDAEGVLRAGEQAARCTAVGAVVIAPWGEANVLNFTASRRLSLAAAQSSVPIFMLRAAAHPSQSAASTRWSVRSAPSRALEANAPGHPAFNLTLLRHRGGVAGQSWRVEWDRERKCFQDVQLNDYPQVSRPMVPVSGDGQAASAAHPLKWRKAG